MIDAVIERGPLDVLLDVLVILAVWAWIYIILTLTI